MHINWIFQFKKIAITKTQVMSTRDIEEMIKTLPQHTLSWLKGRLTLYNYQGIWFNTKLLVGVILAQQSFKARPNDLFLRSHPKSGTTWLKAIVFAIITRQKFDEPNTPLLTTMPHNLIPSLEKNIEQILENRHNNSCLTAITSNIPYNILPESIRASNCKIVYIYRNIKDVIVSYYHFLCGIHKVPIEDAPFEEAFDEFCRGFNVFGPYWDHILGYAKASLERPDITLLLKYEDMIKDPTSNVKRLAEFIGYPFTAQEEKEGVIESIIKMTSFENLSNLEVNKSGLQQGERVVVPENRLYFRKGKVGDSENHFTDEMNEKIDKLIDEKLGHTGLVLK
ncbi:putative quercetin-3-sulfate 4'-sulfotransferase [Helianthus annuus]|nr:putative quercetin-3-sulfate 4'-sulfotransferase [Helianthus annuus]